MCISQWEDLNPPSMGSVPGRRFIWLASICSYDRIYCSYSIYKLCYIILVVMLKENAH